VGNLPLRATLRCTVLHNRTSFHRRVENGGLNSVGSGDLCGVIRSRPDTFLEPSGEGQHRRLHTMHLGHGQYTVGLVRTSRSTSSGGR
jgi:hypothetical protein